MLINAMDEIVQENRSDAVMFNCAEITPLAEKEVVEETTNSVDASECSNETCEASADEEQKLPILKKFNYLSDQIQILRTEYTALSNEVKGMTADSFPGSDFITAFQDLSAEHELLKKKRMEECEFLKKKYLEECAERKRLSNEVIELKGNIRVFCRCRPMNQDELANGSTSVVEIDPSQENELHIISADSSKKQFKFDHVFGPHDSQEAVFAQTSSIVTSVMDGYNVCIFAYGQTGTGKTFTMEGTPENRGVNYRTLEELFRIANERSSIMMYELSVSMLEVYNEKIRDLLVENSNQPVKRLEIKQAAEGTQEVPGLVEAHVYDTDGVWELLRSGSRVRSVGSTNGNEVSSRSHCLLRVTVKGENLVNGQRSKSNLWLVDLAGSERVGRIEVEGERLKESQFINKSLSALGDVISALASKTAHVPYRNSKLTHLLQSSLGGDCKTLMFVQISPSGADIGETLCSLNFASRVRGIEYGPARKQADVNELLKYKQLAEKLKHEEKEAKKLQDNVQSLQLRLAAKEHICRSLQEKVRDLENQLIEERRIRLKQENRTIATASARPSSFAPVQQTRKIITDKRPPLGPLKVRPPLQRISNFLPPQLAPTNKTTLRSIPRSANDKENTYDTVASASNTKAALMRPRRVSIAVRPPPLTTQTLKPKRRVSIATICPESSSLLRTPTSVNAQSKHESSVKRQSFLREPSRVRRFSKIFSPLPETKAVAGSLAEATPIYTKNSSKFTRSPPTLIGSWKPKHPTVVALQKKPLVWSPLKLRGLKNHRKSSIFP
ncbi:Kinesin-like protein KIN-14S [Ancistrocladus abbreviatus]